MLSPPPSLTSPIRRRRSPARSASISTSLITIIVFGTVVVAISATSTLAAGLAYVVGFLLITWQAPVTGLMIAAAAAVYPVDVGGGPVMIALGELSIVLAFPLLMIKQASAGRAVRSGPTIISVSAYLLVCILSSLMHWHGGNSLASLGQMLIYLIITPLVFAYFPRMDEDAFPVLYAYISSACFLGICVIATRSAYLFGIHKNNIGSTLSCALIITVETLLYHQNRRRPWLLKAAIAVLMIALVLSASRGAWMGAAGGVLLLLLIRGQMRLSMKLFVLLLPLITLAWWLMPEERKSYVTESAGDSVAMRQRSIRFAWAQFSREPILGAGLGLRKEYDATNVVLSLLAETGILGFLAFLWIHISFLRMAWSARRRIDSNSKNFSLLAAGVALVIAKLFHGCVDHYWSRGSLTMIWGGAGFATALYLQSRANAKPRWT